jgi:hypothetical protein
MRCAAVIIVVSIAFASQAFAVLRPLFPAKASPPFNSGTIITGSESIQHDAKQTLWYSGEVTAVLAANTPAFACVTKAFSPVFPELIISIKQAWAGMEPRGSRAT